MWLIAGGGPLQKAAATKAGRRENKGGENEDKERRGPESVVRACLEALFWFGSAVLGDFGQEIGALSAFEVRMAVAGGVGNGERLKIIVVFHQETDRSAGRLRGTERVAENIRRPAPAIDGNQMHARRKAGFRGGRSRCDVLDAVSIVAARSFDGEAQ